MSRSALVILLIVFISFLFTHLAVKDVILKDFGSRKTKMIWHFIAIIPFIGWLIYLIFGSKKGHRKTV